MSPHVVRLTVTTHEARCIPGIDRQRDCVGDDKRDEPYMECTFPIRERVKTQGHPRKHGHPDNMCHSEQPNEALALVDQGLGEHSHPYGCQGDLSFNMSDEQQACAVHGYEPCAPDSLQRLESNQNDSE